MKIVKPLIISNLILIFALSIAGQNKSVGSVGTWTSNKVSRARGDINSEFKEIRIAKHNGFDRFTVEFGGGLPNWEISYIKPPIPFSESGERLKIDGKAFVVVAFSVVPYPDSPPENIVLEFSKEKLKLPIINEIKNSDWFEGYLSFAVGLKEKRLYRVRELSKPTRLVIDFKH